MPREVKQNRRAFEEALNAGDTSRVSTTKPVLPPSSLQIPPGRMVPPRWFGALDPGAEAPTEPARPSGAPAVSATLALAAVAVTVLVKSTVPRIILPVVLLLAAAVAVRQWLKTRAAPPPERPRPARESAAPAVAERTSRWRARWGTARGIELDGERLAFHDGAAQPQALLLLDAPFGVTLLASPRRDRVIALLSSVSGTFYLGAVFDAPARRAFAPLLDRCYTIIGDDAGMEAIGPDGEPLVLAPEELASLLDALVEESPSCLDRFVLTDARGASITLDGRQLCIGERTVDLNAPLEWKPIVFQEAFGQAIAVYQGTWLRQSGTELTLVSLLPALGPPPSEGLDLGTLDRTVLRDLRLMQASPEAPPPIEQRVAIDRLFMLPVRSALDRAPRASHQPNRAQAG